MAHHQKSWEPFLKPHSSIRTFIRISSNFSQNFLMFSSHGKFSHGKIMRVSNVSINGSTPIAGWFIMGTPIYKWMMTGGTPILGHLHMMINHDEPVLTAITSIIVSSHGGCSWIFTIIRHYSPLFTIIHHYSPLFTTIHHHSPSFTIITSI